MPVAVSPQPLSGNNLRSQYRIALRTRNKLLSAGTRDSRVILDISRSQFFLPTFLAPICVTCNQLTRSGCEVSVKEPPSYPIKSYLNQIKFPLGTEKPGEEYDNQIPLCLMNTELEDGVVEIISGELTKLLKKCLTSMKQEHGIEWIKYPITEIIDNVDDHSNCNYGAVIVQNYPTKEFLDICIADDGISIPGSYDTYDVSYDDDLDAIQKAMVEGISTKPNTGHLRGFGLRTTVEMVCDGLSGEVFLSSRNATISRIRNRDSSEICHDMDWSGTVFAARLHPPDDDFHYLDYVSPT